MDLYKAPLIGQYFKWLQKDTPTGGVERFPVLKEDGETTLQGVYVAGDLTGVPLLKLAAESGAERIRQFCEDPQFQAVPQDSDHYDVIIVGAGPSGLAAAMECEKNALKYLVLEASKILNTIENFPKAKPILAKPEAFKQLSGFPVHDGVKEPLLEQWRSLIDSQNLSLKTGVQVNRLSRKNDLNQVDSSEGEFFGQRVLLCIGKSGNARTLGCTGDDLEKVLNRLFDPQDYIDQEVLVVGGGDSALESAIALAQAGASVTHSYRKAQWSRPKEENAKAWQSLVEEGKIKALLPSEVQEIQEEQVLIKTSEGVQTYPNDVVFSLIGRELPVDFFKRSAIQMEGEKSLMWWVNLTTMLSFFTMLYFGKKGLGIDIHQGDWIQSMVQTLSFPVKIWFHSKSFEAWMAMIGWLGMVVFIVSGVLSLKEMWRLRSQYFSSSQSWLLSPWLSFATLLMSFSLWVFTGNSDRLAFAHQGLAAGAMWLCILSFIHFVWSTFHQGELIYQKIWPRIKYTYLVWGAVFFTLLYFQEFMDKSQGWSEPATYWYSFLYCTTMALFGARRAFVKPTRYIRLQMLSVNLIQVLFLFLLPFHIYDWVLKPFEGSLLLDQLFPQGKWSSFGFILFWPLNMWQFGSSMFWTIFPFIQTFGFLWYIVYRFGKGAYCGWICSCGGMAESLGDEYRNLAPHGPKAKKWENLGQFILLFSFVVAGLKFIPGEWGQSYFEKTYVLLIDIFFAGVLGLGVYFFMGGRVWCRFGCPLASLMHIFTRFSRYRIVSEKKACISCNTCTKVCHMGIDVMNYANKGIPMNDAECVRCSSCIQSCPMDVLSFAEVESDPENQARTQVSEQGKDWWGAGLK